MLYRNPFLHDDDKVKAIMLIEGESFTLFALIKFAIFVGLKTHRYRYTLLSLPGKRAFFMKIYENNEITDIKGKWQMENIIYHIQLQFHGKWS